MRKPLSVYRESGREGKKLPDKRVLSYEFCTCDGTYLVPPVLEDLFGHALNKFHIRMNNPSHIRAALQEADNRENLDIVTLESR